ncbi:MAG TPA: hypothetical protein VMU25_02190 [Candidatus Paceibacterota bacterium]|nr:hypothetical protein [Candidatus Paceibacterota bacterium]
MHDVSVLNRSIVSAGIASVLLLVVSLISPQHAAAQAATIQTDQLLPGQSSCQQLSITSLQPHVYDGMLESFDVTVSDNNNAYVGILSTVNGGGLSLDMITRWAGDTGGLRFHVDTPDTPVIGSVPVTLTLLASLPNHATCIAQISFNVDMSSNTISAPMTESNVSVSPVPSTIAANPVKTHHVTQKAGHPLAMASSSANLVGAGIAAESASPGFGSICATTANAYKLWFVLLVLYIALVVVVIFFEPWFLRESVLTSTAAILVPLIVLLGFWYFSESCRAASWIPVSACVIAIIGLFLAFREYETTPLLASSNAKI